MKSSQTKHPNFVRMFFIKRTTARQTDDFKEYEVPIVGLFFFYSFYFLPVLGGACLPVGRDRGGGIATAAIYPTPRPSPKRGGKRFEKRKSPRGCGGDDG